MHQAISLHSLVPVRTTPSEAAEMDTQMLFGERCEVLEVNESWSRIRLLQDGQEGWVDSKMISMLSDEDLQSIPEKANARVVLPMAYAVSENNGQTLPLTAGTGLYNYKDGRFEVLGVGFRIDPSMVLQGEYTMDEAHLLQTVRFFLNIPYLWGGKNAMGMDCSGFTQVLFSLFGVSLPRNASQQARLGDAVLSLKDAKAGDLVFFSKPGDDTFRISHVGVLIDSTRIVHCSGRVKVEKIDDEGIFSVERASEAFPQGMHTHHLVAIKRMY